MGRMRILGLDYGSKTVGVAVILAGVYIANMTTKRTASN